MSSPFSARNAAIIAVALLALHVHQRDGVWGERELEPPRVREAGALSG